MDNLGIFGFLNNLSKFYQENKSDFDSVTNTNDNATTAQETTDTPKKTDSEIKPYPAVYFSEKFIATMKAHDEFVKRVKENNKPIPPTPKKRGRKPKPKADETSSSTPQN